MVNKTSRNLRGASMLEFGLLLVLVSVLAFPALTKVGLTSGDAFCRVKDAENPDGANQQLHTRLVRVNGQLKCMPCNGPIDQAGDTCGGGNTY